MKETQKKAKTKLLTQAQCWAVAKCVKKYNKQQNKSKWKQKYLDYRLTVDSKVKDFKDFNFRLSDDFRTEHTTFADVMGHRTALPSNNRIRFNGNITRDNMME